MLFEAASWHGSSHLLLLLLYHDDGTTLASWNGRTRDSEKWGNHRPVELLLGLVVPRVLALVSLGRHPVVRWRCVASA